MQPRKPMTNAEVEAVTVGERVALNGPVELHPYSQAWVQRYGKIARVIGEQLGAAALAVYHVGSTAVPGIPAKPIVDVVLVVTDASAEAAYVPLLERAGFELYIREPEWHEHRLLKCKWELANVHVFSTGCEEIDRMLVFRDRLRSNAADRSLYVQTKTELAAKTWKHVQNYADAKSEVVADIMSRALDVAGKQNSD